MLSSLLSLNAIIIVLIFFFASIMVVNIVARIVGFGLDLLIKVKKL